LQQRKVQLEERDLGKQPLAEQELDQLIGARSHLDFLNPKNELYRSRNMAEHPPTRQEALPLMAKNPNLIRRPIVRRGNQWVLGFDAVRFEALTK
jgi:arsenate reductase-like glutaredoxin family protein